LRRVFVDAESAGRLEVEPFAFKVLHVVDEAERPAEDDENERVPEVQFLHDLDVLRVRPADVQDLFVASEGADQKHDAMQGSARMEVKQIVDVDRPELVSVRHVRQENQDDQDEGYVREKVHNRRLSLLRGEQSQVSQQTDRCGR
jgi:hypothetical protein